MLEKLVDLVLQFASELAPFTVINQFSAGIVLRWGRFHRELTPGFYWKIPFADRVHEDIVITTTEELPSQTLTTKDRLQVVVKSIVKYNIKDIQSFMLNIYDAKDAIGDITQGLIKKEIAGLDWSQCNDNSLDNTVTKKVRAELKKYGIEVENLTFTNIGLARSIRLFNEKDPEHKQL